MSVDPPPGRISMDLIDFAPATTELARLVAAVTDDQLGAATPCEQYAVGDLLDHVAGLTVAFTAAARKEPLDGTASGDASRLAPDFRQSINADLAELARAWADPAAYDGMTAAGGIDLPGGVAAQVALNEVVVHGWDLAVATGQDYAADPAAVAACTAFVSSFEVPPEAGEGPFGPPVPAPDDATDLEQLVALTGRAPR